jgi:hypothetical protein
MLESVILVQYIDLKKSPIITISPILFTFNACRMSIAVAHQRNILEIQKQVEILFGPTELLIFVKNLNSIS